MIKPLKNFTSFSKLEYYKVYSTKDYGIFKIHDCNRGTENGFTQQKLNEIALKFLLGIFMMKLQFIIVNKKGVIFEGNNRFEYFRRNNLEVYFMVVDEDMINSTPENFTKAMINFNGTDQSWKTIQIYNAARIQGSPVAIEIHKMMGKAFNSFAKKGIKVDKKSFNVSKIMGIVKFDADGIHGKKPTWDDFYNDSYYSLLISATTQKNINFLCSLYEIISDNKRNDIQFETRNFVETAIELFIIKADTYGFAKNKFYTIYKNGGFQNYIGGLVGKSNIKNAIIESMCETPSKILSIPNYVK